MTVSLPELSLLLVEKLRQLVVEPLVADQRCDGILDIVDKAGSVSNDRSNKLGQDLVAMLSQQLLWSEGKTVEFEAKGEALSRGLGGGGSHFLMLSLCRRSDAVEVSAFCRVSPFEGGLNKQVRKLL